MLLHTHAAAAPTSAGHATSPASASGQWHMHPAASTSTDVGGRCCKVVAAFTFTLAGGRRSNNYFSLSHHTLRLRECIPISGLVCILHDLRQQHM